ncbi:MAG: hypothetical protein IKD71_00805 [Solobacterium sp.]|nr:hypothetical protein [Solobacterium sp.]
MKSITPERILLCLLIPFLTGCSGMTKLAAAQIEKESNFEEFEEYQRFKEYESHNYIDENGNYIENEVVSDEIPEGSIHVTFGENNHIRLNYYSDPEKQNQLNTNNCYLNPGDSIYSTDPTLMSYTNTYHFYGFTVYEFDESGNREDIDIEAAEDSLVYQIPQDYTGNKLMILPYGKYYKRYLVLNDLYRDGSGEQALNGQWFVDQNEVEDDDLVEISSINSYTVKYDFSDYTKDYYFYQSTPKPFLVDDENGIVQFSQEGPRSTVDQYTVIMRPYKTLTISIKSNYLDKQDYIKSLQIKGIEETMSDKTMSVPRIKPGDRIIIRVAEDRKVTGTGVLIGEPVKVSEGYEYKITVQDIVSGNPTLTVSKRNDNDGNYVQEIIEHGTISLMHQDGSLITDGDSMDAKENVIVTIVPEEGYYISGGEVKNNQYQDNMTYEKYCSDRTAIVQRHPIKKYVVVYLDEDDPYGECVYTVENKVVHDVVQMKEGEVLQLTYNISDTDYIISRPDGIPGFLGELARPHKKSVNITITPEIDGKTIKRDEYIQIEKATGWFR